MGKLTEERRLIHMAAEVNHKLGLTWFIMSLVSTSLRNLLKSLQKPPGNLPDKKDGGGGVLVLPFRGEKRVPLRVFSPKRSTAAVFAVVPLRVLSRKK